MRSGRRALAILILAAAYFLAGRLGLSLAFLHPSASPIWPPSGIGLAALLLFGRHLWPGILLGAFLVNALTPVTPVGALVIAGGNTLESIVGAALVTRFARGRFAFQRPQDVFKFAGLAGGVATVVSASIGVTTLALGGLLSWDAAAAVWLTWWLGDAVGILLVAPTIILWAKNPRIRWSRSQGIEMLVYTLVLVVTTQIIWARPVGPHQQFLGFLCIPILIWPAFRFGRRESAAALLLLSAIAVWRTRLGYGPFSIGELNQSLLVLQVCMGAIALTVLSVAATVLERTRATEELQKAHRQLEVRIAERTAELATAQALAHIGSWRWDIPANRVVWSDELYRIFGLEPGSLDITYESYLELIPPEDRDRVDAIVRDSWRSGAPFEFEHRVVRPDGTLRWVHALGQVQMALGGAVRMDGTAHDITEQKAAELERKRLEHEILEISGREQQRIGHDLHDDLGQLLTGVALMSKTLEKKLGARGGPEAAELAEIRALVHQAIGKTRNMARVLSPVLETGGFVSALQSLASSAEQMFDVSCTLHCSSSLTLRRELTGVHLYRIVQEAISNAVRHGKADRILITVETAGRALRLRVRDNGAGLAPGWEQQAGFGLRIMKYRATLISGELRIESDVHGTEVTCTVPDLVTDEEREERGTLAPGRGQDAGLEAR